MNEETCPFCGVSVIPASLDGTSNSFVPPYAPHLTRSNEVPPSPYGQWSEDSQEPSKESANGSSEPEPSMDEFKKVVVAVTFLLGGSVFFLFGLALVLFSTEGTFSLKWDGSFWYFYMILAIPMLYFGWKSLMKLD
ncbi:MAG: hypothetical protein WCF65_00740 [Parachlamydiaceae bacterium]